MKKISCRKMNRATSLCVKCFVPSCKNTTTNSRNKVFVVVKDSLKLKWCRELNIRYEPARRMFCCEDHLNLEEDLVNYQKWKIMKGRAELKSTAKLRLNKAPYSVDDSPALKSILLRPIENLPMERAIDNSSFMKPSVSSTSTHPVVVDAAVQFHVDLMDKSTSTEDLKNMKKIKPIHSVSPSSVSTSDIKSPSLYGCTSDTETTVTPAVNVRPSISTRMQLLELITINPKPYLGMPKQYFWLINHITTQSKTKVSDLEIIITLMKIKLNDPITRMCDQFQISRVTFSKYLYNGIQVLASFFQNLIYLPTLLQIKQNLPLAFKIRYSNVQLIIDAFEMEIQKPHNPVRQAQSWSQYKNGNTIKYLIGCTPKGFVAYVSKGYGGRISDKALVEKSCLIDYLPHNAVIMADRGFKEVEALLATKGIKLLRPPSVYASNKPTKEEVIQTKVVASLRVHVERVIRRVREFRFLKPHSVVSHKHIGYLDHIVLIACGLINLQNEIIKSE